jgi:tape measure domain-containing protein
VARASTFTTYINAKDDPSVNSAFDRLTTKAVSSYDKIRIAATSASKAQLGLLGGSGSAGGGAAASARGIDSQAKAVDQLARSYRSASPAVTGLVTPTRAQGAAAELAAKHNSALANSLRTTATALNVVQGPLGPVAGRVGALANAVERLTGFRLGLVGVGAALFTIGRLGNNYTQLTSQVKGAFVSQERSNIAMSDIVGIADRAKVSLESVTGLYIRLSQAASEAGVSQRDATRVTELAAKAARLSGGSRDAQNASLTQFTQAYGGNFKGGGQELQSVIEGANQLAAAIAKGLGVPLGALKKLGEEGKLSTEIVTQALLKSAGDIEGRYAALGNTLGGSLSQLGNAGTVMVGKFDEAIGFTSNLANGIAVVAANLRAVTGLILGVGVALGAARVGPFIQKGIDGITKTVEALQREAALKRGNALQDQFYALEAEKNSAREVVDTRARVAALAQEKVAIDTKIAALQAERIVAVEIANSARQSPIGVSTPTRGQRGVPLGTAERGAQVATRNLAQEQEKLRGVQAALATETELLVTTQNKFALASNNAIDVLKRGVPRVGLLTSAFGLLKTAGSGLLALFGGPWGLAFAAATTALFLLSTQTTAAARAADDMRNAQSNLSQFVDATTGKIIEQNSQLVKNRQLQAQDRRDTARTGFTDSIGALRKATRGSQLDLGLGNGQIGGAVQSAADKFLSSGNARDLKTLQDSITNLEKFAPGAARKVNDLLTGVVTSAAPLRQVNAELRLLAKGGRDGDTDRAFGNRPNARTTAPKPLTSQQRNQAIRDGQIAANANSENDLKKAAGTRDKALQDLKKDTTLTAAQYAEQATAIQQRYNSEVEGIRAAKAAATAARVQARRDAAEAKAEARDAIQDGKDAAQAKADADLTKLYQSGQDPDSQPFLDARKKILKTYDDEVNKLDERAAASHRASSQILADARKEAEAADNRAEKRTGILAQYDESPKAVDNARKSIAELQELVGHVVAGVGKYTQAAADSDAQRIYAGIQRPLTEIFQKSQEQLAIDGLILQGREAEATALGQALDLRRQGVTVDQQRYEALVRNVQQEQAINDALSSRSRITSEITALVDTGRQSLTGLLTAIQSGSKINNPLADIKNQLFRVSATQITEKLFAGADAKVRALLTGRSAVDKAVDNFETTVTNIDGATNKVVSAFDGMVAKLNQATAALNIPAASTGGVTGPVAANDNRILRPDVPTQQIGDEFVVTGRKLAQSFSSDPDVVSLFKTISQTSLKGDVKIPGFKTPTASQAGAAIFSNLGSKLDSVVDRLKGKKAGADGGLLDNSGKPVSGSQFFNGIGAQVGKALAGAGNGEFASGIAKAVGIKQSKLGSQIGGAVGQSIAGPIGGLVGGLIGGTFGGLFKKDKQASSTLTFNTATNSLAGGTAVGSGTENKQAAKQLSGALASQLTSIAELLGGSIGGAGSVSIGYRPGHKAGAFRVDGTGSGKVAGGNVQAFDTEEEAIAAASRDAIQDGVITGISQASQNILRSGQDLQRALTKAMAIEDIPKRLLALTDPVRSAVTNLNADFTKLISYLKEGGATAQQFADAQKLYELERAQAIEAATQQASNAIDAFLKNLTGSSNSPLNKRDTYASASSTLSAFRGDIAAGKSVDQDKLLAAVTNFQDASKNLYGSSQAFFTDFDDIRALLTKARDNIATPSTGQLPASPFASDASVQAALASLQTTTTKATTDGTSAIVAALGAVVAAVDKQTDALASVGVANDSGYGSAIGLLPAFASR